MEPGESKPVLRIENKPDSEKVRIRDIKFEGAKQLSFTEQDLIALEIMACEDVDSRSLLDKVEDRVSEAWQQRGFFKVQTRAESRDLSSPAPAKEIELSVTIKEGKQYRLDTIRFLHATQFTNEQLRPLFPISEGDIFDTQKIKEGGEALRKLYEEAGFINFIALADTAVDEQNARLVLNIEVAEGKQFHISEVKVIGIDQKVVGALLRKHRLERGTVVDQRNVDEFARDMNLTPDEDIERRVDEKRGTVVLLVDARHCP